MPAYIEWLKRAKTDGNQNPDNTGTAINLSVHHSRNAGQQHTVESARLYPKAIGSFQQYTG